MARFQVIPNDIIISCSGTVGRMSVIADEDPPGIISQALLVLRPQTKRILPRFLYYVLSTRRGRDQLLQASHGSVQVNIAPRRVVENINIPVPSISEQRAIIGILGALDNKIEVNGKIGATLEAMARALFKSWFVDFDPVRAKAEGRDPDLPPETAALFPDSFEDSELGEIPKGWKLGSLTDTGTLNPEAWSCASRPDVIRYVDLSSVKWGKFERSQLYDQAKAPSRAQRVLRPGDTLIGTVRPANGSYALVADEGLTGSTGFAVLRPTRSKSFTYPAATAKENIDRLGHLADGGAYPAVRPEVVGATPIALALDNVLRAFDAVASPLLDRYAQAEHESRTLTALRDALLPKLISGEIRVADGERIVEGSA